MCVCDKHDDDLAFLCNFKYLFPARTALNIIYIYPIKWIIIPWKSHSIPLNAMKCQDMPSYTSSKRWLKLKVASVPPGCSRKCSP